jgi:hypothetical protein
MPGTLTVTVRELWNEPAWYRLGAPGANDIVAAYEQMARGAEMTAQMIIRSPAGQVRGRTYHNCLITSLDDTETVTIGALTVAKNITLVYSHKTGLGGRG